MDPIIITWNFTNWVTVVLMALLGFLLLSLVINGLSRLKAGSAASVED